MQRVGRELVLPELGRVRLVEQVPVVGRAVSGQVPETRRPVAVLSAGRRRRRHARWHHLPVQLLRHGDDGVGAALFNGFRSFR